jgi:hypothetical protein
MAYEWLEYLENSPQFDKTVRGKVIKIGRQDEKQPFSILYSSETFAADVLYDEILALIQNKKWNWVKKPVIERFQMTECPVGSMSHRTVVPRYAGYCEIEVEV